MNNNNNIYTINSNQQRLQIFFNEFYNALNIDSFTNNELMTQVIEQEGIPRSLPDSIHLNESFLIRDESDVAQQYLELYKHRLQHLRPCLEKSIRKNWGIYIIIYI